MRKSAQPLRYLLLGVALAALTALAPLAAAADTVYLRNNKTLVGKVTKTDGKYKVVMPYGTIEVDVRDVIYVAYGTGTTRPARTARPSRPERVIIRPQTRWNLHAATLPDPIVFMLTRQVELLAGEPGTEGARRQLQAWKIFAHEGRRKFHQQWLTRDQQRRRRLEFEKRIREAKQLAQQARSIYGRSPADAARKQKLLARKVRLLQEATDVWPDGTVGEFLRATLDLAEGDYRQAERRFRRCIEREPLVAAFHQGRGYALSGMNQHLDALAEFVACLELRDDTYLTVQLVEKAMKEVPGARVTSPTYARARDLLARYEPPEYGYRSYGGMGPRWLMPGKSRGWQWRTDLPFDPIPPYDRVVSKQALGLPVTDDGALLVDKDAVAGAKVLYVQLGPDRLVRAYPVRITTGYGSKKVDLPLTIIRAEGVTFTPVDPARPAPLKAGQSVRVLAVNLYRQMGTELRKGQAEVREVVEGRARLDRGLLPGEAIGAIFAEERFAGLLGSRVDVEAPGCGRSEMIPPGQLSTWMENVRRSLRYASPMRRWGGPKLKPDAPKLIAEGKAFLVHALWGEIPPPPVVK